MSTTLLRRVARRALARARLGAAVAIVLSAQVAWAQPTVGPVPQSDPRLVGILQSGNNLSDLASAAAGRANLGLAPVASAGTFSSLTGLPATFPPPIATNLVVGGVKQGANVTIAADGTISSSGGGGSASAPATHSVAGTVIPNASFSLDGSGNLGIVSAPEVCSQAVSGRFFVECFGSTGSGNTLVSNFDAAWNAALAYQQTPGNSGASVVLGSGPYSACNNQQGELQPQALTTGGGASIAVLGDQMQAAAISFTCTINRTALPAGALAGQPISQAGFWQPIPATPVYTSLVWHNVAVYANGKATLAADFEGLNSNPDFLNTVFRGAAGDGTSASAVVRFGNSNSSYAASSWTFGGTITNMQIGGGAQGSGFAASVSVSGPGVPTFTITNGGSGYSANAVVYINLCANQTALPVTVNGSGAITAVNNPTSQTYFACTGTTYAHAFDPTYPTQTGLYLDHLSDTVFNGLQPTTGTQQTVYESNLSGSNTFNQAHPCCLYVPVGFHDVGLNNAYNETECDGVGQLCFQFYNAKPKVTGTKQLWSSPVSGAGTYFFDLNSAGSVSFGSCAAGLLQNAGGYQLFNYSFGSQSRPANLTILAEPECSDGANTLTNVLPGVIALTALQSVDHTYVAAGAIAITDHLAKLRPTAATTYTLAAGTVAGSPITFNNVGSATATITVSSFYGVANMAVPLGSGAVKNLYWDATDSTYYLAS